MLQEVVRKFCSVSLCEEYLPCHSRMIHSGLISFIFGALTLIFFILIQIRVYGAYGKNVQSTIPATNNFCRSALIRGALAMIILTYINVILFSIIVLLVVYGLRKNIQKKKQIDMEMVPTAHIDRL